jgi:hypothetical protein
VLLVTTTDTIKLVTSAAITVDVHASYVDKNQSTSAISEGPQNTLISTATTTTVVSAPAATTTRKVKLLTARNRGASPVDVTVLHDRNGTSAEMHKVTLQAGEALEYVEGLGFYSLTQPTPVDLAAAALATITANAADTYLTGPTFPLARLKAGSVLRWLFDVSKTAAGVATPIWNVRTGTAGSTADTSRATMTGKAQTAAADTGTFIITATVRSGGASGSLKCNMALIAHDLAATGLANQAVDQENPAVATAIDFTASGALIGVSCNPGTAGVWTFEQATLLVANPLK